MSKVDTNWIYQFISLIHLMLFYIYHKYPDAIIILLLLYIDMVVVYINHYYLFYLIQ